MLQVCDINKCSGCGACYSVCPHAAISMTERRLGTIVPDIDSDKCIDCGLCVKVCPVNVPQKQTEPSIAYAAYAKSPDERSSSASGGIATLLSRRVLEEGGVVYGCTMESPKKITHIRVDNPDALDMLKGSKYVQSQTAHVFREIRKDLNENRTVLFIGTPCQVAGLKNYIGNARSSVNLMTVDLCCHGTPSQRLLYEHLSYLGVEDSSEVAFRDKANGQIQYVLKVRNGDRIYNNPAHRDYYMTGFLSGLFLRESCFTCQYASSRRCSDLTLADHWAMGACDDPEMVVSKGLSSVLVNSEKGRVLFESIRDVAVCEERPMKEALSNSQFISPVVKPTDYDAFAESFEINGYRTACKKFMPSYQRMLLGRMLKTMYYKWPLRQYIRKLLKR